MSTTRVKDAGFLQQHIEKLILGVGVLVLLLALVLFMVGNPFKIVVAGTEYDDADGAVGVLSSSDKQLETGLSAKDPLGGPIAPPQFLDDYQAMIDQPVISGNTVPRLAQAGLTYKALTPDIPEPPRYAMVYPPVPKDVEYAFGTDVLDTEFRPEIVQAFFDLWGEQREPADFSMIIVAAKFDNWEWSQRLRGESETAPTGNGIKIPIGIWAKRFGIAGVALLREEWDEASQIWTNRQYVSALPDQKRVLPMDEVPTNPLESMAYVERMREIQPEIANPELPYLINYVQAVAPGGDELLEGAEGFDEFGNPLDEENLGPAERRVKEWQDKIQALEERRRIRDERLQGRPDRQDRPRRPGRPPREFDDFGDGGGDFDRPRDRDRGERRDPIQSQIEDLQARIESLQEKASRERDDRMRRSELRRAQLEEERRRREERLAREGGGLGGEFGIGQAVEGVQLQEGQTVRVWAADPTMKPGKTYRYKIVVATINPLYAVPRLPSDQLTENQGRAAILPTEKEIEEMEWIGPVTVEPRARIFFTSGTNRAKVDIYRRYEGVLYKEDFDVSPGDPIGGVVTIKSKDEFIDPVTVDFNVDSILVDIERRRDLNNNNSYTMIYMDAEGNLYERSQTKDKSHPDKRDLDSEIKEGSAWPLRPDPDADRIDDFGGGEFGGFGGFDGF